MYVQLMTEVILSHIQNTVGNCKQICYQISSYW